MTPEGTDFLYPFIEGAERDATVLVGDLESSAMAKMTESVELRDATLDECSGEMHRAAHEMARRFELGGRLFTAGNGGSATDAQLAASLFARPPTGKALPALSLADDEAVLTGLGNDVGFELTFSRQVVAYGSALDMMLGVSTSGSSRNLLKAFDTAKAKGLLVIGLAGYEGGEMAACGLVDRLFVVRSQSVHRVQESHNAVLLALWEEVQRQLRSMAPAS